MKVFIPVIYFLLLSSNIFCQTKVKNYLVFFGHNYELTNDSLLTDFEGNNLIIPLVQNKFEYCIRKNLYIQKNVETIPSILNPDETISKTSYENHNCYKEENIVDSFNVSKIDKEKEFYVFCRGNKFKIISFTIICDSNSVDFSYNTTRFIYDNYFNKTVERNLFEIFDELNLKTKCFLTNIWYYDSIQKKKFLLDLSFLLINS